MRKPIPYGLETRQYVTDLVVYKEAKIHDVTKPCHDCGVKPTQYHKPGCDDEECPFCRGQLISCGHHSKVRVMP